VDRPIRFAKYELLRRIAVGGMAEIFLARQRGLAGFEKILAVKRIRKKYTAEPSFVQMFLNEARIAARLSHPNVVQIFDLGKAEGCFFIAMEHVHGRNLSEVVQRAEENRVRFPLEYAVKIASQVCDGLHYAHTKRDADGTPLDIVHRDISPLNLLVSFDGVVKILDFGIARAERYYREERDGGKKVKGKLTYMAPETVEGQKEDNRTDVFALGMVFYELITGLKVRSQKSDRDLFRSILKGKIHPPSFFRADLPEEVEEIALKALARDPTERYQHARDMQYDLDAFLVESGFNPGALHLANFVRQLFQEDLEREDKQLAEIAKARPAPGKSTEHDFDAFDESEDEVDDEYLVSSAEPDPPAAEAMADKSKGPPKIVALRLGRGEFDVLREAGRRHGKTAGEIAREIVRAHLKFL